MLSFKRALLLTALALVAIPSAAHAQNWLSSAIPPEIRTHDFGTVARAAKTEHRFPITNNGNQDLHLQSIRASCGCTTPTIENKIIKPGQTGYIHAKFNTGSFTGQKQATLTVTITQPQFTELQLLVRGYIRSDVVLNPGEIEFGAVPEGERKVVEATLDYAGRSDWEITDITTSLPFVKAKFEEISRATGRIQYKIVAGIDGNAPAGMLTNQLVLHTNDRRLTTVPITLSADVQPALQFTPQNFELGRVKPGEPIQQRLVVKGKQPFRILDITSSEAEVRYDPISESKQAHLVNITISPNSKSRGEVSGTVRMKTDMNDKIVDLGLKYTIETGSPGFEQASKIK